MERRLLIASPVKLEQRKDGQDVISGYGAVFYDPEDPGTEYELWSDLRERIMPTAFDRCLRENQDVMGLFNHDANMVLGRSSAGTMTCKADARGLSYSITPGKTTCARDMIEHLTRGDVTGSSFSFMPRKCVYIEQKDGPDIREVHDVDLFDVGPVTFPAYTSTTAGMRAAGEVDADLRADYDRWKSGRSGRDRRNTTAAQARVLARRVEL